MFEWKKQLDEAQRMEDEKSAKQHAADMDANRSIKDQVKTFVINIMMTIMVMKIMMMNIILKVKIIMVIIIVMVIMIIMIIIDVCKLEFDDNR